MDDARRWRRPHDQAVDAGCTGSARRRRPRGRVDPRAAETARAAQLPGRDRDPRVSDEGPGAGAVLARAGRRAGTRRPQPSDLLSPPFARRRRRAESG